jgi:hypothetical protein
MRCIALGGRELLSEGGVSLPDVPSFRIASVAGESGIHNHHPEYRFRACAKRRIPE